MSIRTWRRVYYPYEAVLELKENALEHELKHALGFRYFIRLRHRLRLQRLEKSVVGIRDLFGQSHSFNSETRALCIYYEDPAGLECIGCPVYHFRGNVRCDRKTKYENESPIAYFRRTGAIGRYLHILRQLAEVNAGPIIKMREDEAARFMKERMMISRLAMEFREMPLDKPWHTISGRRK